MKSCSTNDIKIYNLSAGKSLPEWLSERKRRSLAKKDVDIRRRIELIQDFDMPGVSTNVQVTPDENFIIATGTYKPRIRCYDVKNLSMKFERCFDSDVEKFLILSEDYSKMVFLQSDRFVEFHVQYGRYFRMRIPKFGRDLAYHTPSCDLFIVGATSEAYRLNLELGRFMIPWVTEAKGINCCAVNPFHYLMTFGTEEGRVEGWDPRSGKKVNSLDAAFHAMTEDTDVDGVPSISSLKFKDSLTLGVGTSTGQILLFDIRSSKPLLVKDHFYSLPIKDIEFHKEENMVMSMDTKIVKIWNEQTGEPYTSVEGHCEFNDLCHIPKTGMFFVANEDRKILTYYIPSLGPAPRWCSFLDSLTEELEETDVQSLYDDYKFVTEKELDDIGLGHLIGTNLLRAYMHGYFMDMRLYRKAKVAVQPFQFNEYKKKRIQERLQRECENRVKINHLPKVNKELAIKLMSEPKAKGKKENILEDNRFKSMFENPDFEIDKSADEFRLLHPIVSKIDKRKVKKLEKAFALVDNDNEEDEGHEGKPSSEEDDESSSDDDREWVKEIRNERRKIQNEKRVQDSMAQIQPKFYEIKPGQDYKMSDIHSEQNKKLSKTSLEERLKREEKEMTTLKGPMGGREMSFHFKKRRNFTNEQNQQHHQERRKIRRSAGTLKNKKHSWKS